ncbi:MAG TPA: preprotein translocase subunit SecA [Candidatus Moranbacteria bacterium]|nr:preprotein translocase subunit SecA [Candidatus Moranbacteria bacterium]
MGFLSNIFGSNEREIAKLRPLAGKINSLEEATRRLSDEELAAKTGEFRQRLAKGETLEDILPEAFAVVREAAERVIGERHYEVQLIGGIVLHQGKIAEMKTGEGKTLTSTLPIYLNALSGKGVHVVTVNDYLARRDCNWMGSIYHFLGLTTACIMHDASYLFQPKVRDADEVTVEMENLTPVSRRQAYEADITYGTNNEFGFDYLRDNMAQSLAQMVQRPLNFAIVDEVDSILIDEARTPLIISAPDSESTKLYQRFAGIVPLLKEGVDYEVDEKMRAAVLTESGIAKVENALGMGNIYDPGKINYVHHLEQSLRAHALYKLDRDYVVKDGEVIIVDDFTGRLMPGRRYSDGLHQAIEAKEGVEVQKESRTLATITFQNYFRMYEKLAGMTGTASTSAEEFSKVYKLDVLEIPTNKSLVRKDLGDVVYKTEKGKFAAIVERIKEVHAKGQPVLVGTIAIEKSEYLSALLKKEGVRHEVLNAKQHEREAAIVADAGRMGAVTIATNMAGRGTDIKLGEGVREKGGLFIIGTERHEARRIDNQLRGRAGRQGDPGVSQFYVSLEDELMRRFGGDRLKGMMDKLGLPEDQPIQNALISKTIESAQTKIEGYNFDMRKHVLEYDDVMNKQREVIYRKRREALEKKEVKQDILKYTEEAAERMVSARIAGGEGTFWDTEGVAADAAAVFAISEEIRVKLKAIGEDRSKNDSEKATALTGEVIQAAKEAYIAKESALGAELMRSVEKSILLQTIDTLWMNHLDEIDYLRQGIGLRGYGQRDPLIEYKREAFNLFSHLVENIRTTVLRTIFHISQVSVETPAKETKVPEGLRYSGADEEVGQFAVSPQKGATLPQKNTSTVGRNDPCPCGSDKKFKKCCGK